MDQEREWERDETITLLHPAGSRLVGRVIRHIEADPPLIAVRGLGTFKLPALVSQGWAEAEPE